MIDSHHHFWWSGRRKYTWPDAVGDRFARDFTPDDLRPELERCGIKGTVLVQVLHQVGGETEECLDLSQRGRVRARRGRLGSARRSGRHGGRARAAARARQARRRAPSHQQRARSALAAAGRRGGIAGAVGRGRLRVRRHSRQCRRNSSRCSNSRSKLPELKIVDQSSRPAADPRAGLGAVGDADCARRPSTATSR